MSPPPPDRPRGWGRKFGDAFRGLAVGVRGQSSFAVHLAALVLVVAAASWLQVTAVEWCLLLLCITLVLAAEFFNSTLERLSRAITREHNADLRDALDISAAAVLCTACGSSLIGLLILLPPLLQRLS